MSDLKNMLLMATLKRRGKPATSDDLIDEANQLGADHDWTPVMLFQDRRSIAKRLGDMEREGLLKVVGQGRDAVARRDIPVYEPMEGFDPHAAVPQPQRNTAAQRAKAREADGKSRDDDLTPRQLGELLDAHDVLAEGMFRLLQHLTAGLNDFAQTREKVRARLLAAGLGSR